MEGSCNTDSSAVSFVLFFFLKDIVFLGMLKQDSLKSVIDLVRYILTPVLPNSNVPLLLCFLGSPGFLSPALQETPLFCISGLK